MISLHTAERTARCCFKLQQMSTLYDAMATAELAAVTDRIQQWRSFNCFSILATVLPAAKKWQMTVADQLEDSIQQRTLELQITLIELAEKTSCWSNKVL